MRTIGRTRAEGGGGSYLRLLRPRTRRTQAGDAGPMQAVRYVSQDQGEGTVEYVDTVTTMREYYAELRDGYGYDATTALRYAMARQRYVRSVLAKRAAVASGTCWARD